VRIPFLSRILRAYARILRSLGLLLALLAASAGLGFMVAWPLWAFATTYSEAYSVFILLLLIVGAAALVARRVIRGKAARSPVAGENRRSPAATGLLILAWLVVMILGVYAAVVLFARGLYGYSIAVLLVLILLLGFLASFIQGKKSPA
jgi:hypothetical protein